MILAVFAVLAVVVAAAVVAIRQTHRDSPANTRAAGPESSSTESTPSGPVPADHLQSVRIAAPNLRTKPGSDEPLVTLTVYEDFLCPVCGAFEKVYGKTLANLIDAGQVAVDYTMVSVLGRGDKTSYSVRAGAMAYCVADVDKGAFRRFHAALFANQPDEGGTVFPTDEDLLKQAQQAGAGGSVADCVHSGKYLAMVNNGAYTADIEGTPTVDLNNEDIAGDLMNAMAPSTLLDKVKAATGDK